MNSKTPDQTPDGGARSGAGEGSLGQQLRRAREARGVTLREISEQTRITMRHLEAIESDDYKHLPGGIFNKSFIKAYARQIGFDERAALELYARTAREHGDTDEVATTPHRSRVYTGDPARSPLVTAGLSAVIIGVLILVVYAGLHYYRRTEGEAGAAQPQPSPAAAAAGQTPAASPTPPPAEGFKVTVRARDRSFWLTSWQDAEKKRGRFLSPEKPEEFTPGEALNLLFDRASADALEVSVNGRPLRTPAGGEAKEITWTITKDNYRQFLP
ncbi:MAG TPA: helix-turn-helix domain-containing protein [Pyrinomonadaceae bacterium]|nr:helix-turn-helix domain-containing protein [Pyrinomonadaceae bacterium]